MTTAITENYMNMSFGDIIAKASMRDLHERSTGELVMELSKRLRKGMYLRVNHKGARLALAQYFDHESSVESIDKAFSQFSNFS